MNKAQQALYTCLHVLRCALNRKTNSFAIIGKYVPEKAFGAAQNGRYPNLEVYRYSGGVNVPYERQNKSVPEVASAIWSESAIGGVRYRRFHCIHNYLNTSLLDYYVLLIFKVLELRPLETSRALRSVCLMKS